MSVNPVDEAKETENGYSVTNANIEGFNTVMKMALAKTLSTFTHK